MSINGDDLQSSNLHELFTGYMSEIYKLLGAECAMKIIHKCGGARLYIPVSIKRNDHPLALLLGWDKAQELTRVLGGLEHFDVPKFDVLVRHKRNKDIIRDKNNGMSQSSLARKYNITSRQVRRIFKLEENLFKPTEKDEK